MLGKQFQVVLLGLLLIAFLAPAVVWAGVVTPDAVQTWFSAQFALVAIGVGVLYKYVPWLKSWPNAAIPWLNAVLFIFTKLGALAGVAYVLGVSPAHAGGSMLGGIVGVGALGALHAIAARQGWEGFLRPLMEWASLALTSKRHPADTAVVH